MHHIFFCCFVLLLYHHYFGLSDNQRFAKNRLPSPVVRLVSHGQTCYVISIWDLSLKWEWEWEKNWKTTQYSPKKPQQQQLWKNYFKIIGVFHSVNLRKRFKLFHFLLWKWCIELKSDVFLIIVKSMHTAQHTRQHSTYKMRNYWIIFTLFFFSSLSNSALYCYKSMLSLLVYDCFVRFTSKLKKKSW